MRQIPQGLKHASLDVPNLDPLNDPAGKKTNKNKTKLIFPEQHTHPLKAISMATSLPRLLSIFLPFLSEHKHLLPNRLFLKERL